ncbi:maleylpyruvate isomerase family mycothiol-dependent enzyme [Streptomyces sp. NPDC058464]|uniref:maleylpyruvate isomerase family mycothiol-dependent enzyme n=1 Tax=Streptomyces sp. NPDC058464 TaxID=3346511 RepID=UPI00364DFCDA
MTSEAVPRPLLLAWLEEGTDLLRGQLDRADEWWVTGSSPLPGWTTAHLLTHLARNADALDNLVTWAATGVETPMYPHGAAGRLRDIEDGARRDPRAILDDVRDSAARLQRSLAELEDAAWTHTVRTAQGRLVTADLIPWLRIREVWIHLVDLGSGVTFSALPDDLATALLPDVIATLARHDDCPAVVVRTEPGGLASATRPDEPIGTTTEVRGNTAELLGWLTGRTSGAGLTASDPGGLPKLPAWL